MYNPLDTYLQDRQVAKKMLTSLGQKSLRYSIARIVVILILVVALYFYLFHFELWLLLSTLVSAVLFLVLVSRHQSIRDEIRYYEVQKDQAEDEIDFIQNNYLARPTGSEYISQPDLYEQDLDLFGDHSLYQYICRAQTYLGRSTLAARIKRTVPTERITDDQLAHQELTSKAAFRREFQIQAELAEIDESTTSTLQHWSEHETPPLSTFWLVMMYVVPIIYYSLIIIELIAGSYFGLWDIIKFGSGALILMLFLYQKKIRNEVNLSDKISSTLRAISKIWSLIEKQNFKSDALQKISNGKNENAQELSKLASIYRNLETISNPLGALIINALIPYHLYYYQQLAQWKRKSKDILGDSPSRIAEWECYISLSQYDYNHPENIYPSLESTEPIYLHGAKHPLMRPELAVPNDLSFADAQFYILTGSNMSGKSTFLRTVGSCLVLARLGATIPASAANIHNQPIYASMRITDSLADESSYFYAELKKLQKIKTQSHRQPSMVLLDEILRGTNSDDKRTGTMEVIKTYLDTQNHGIIATHDLEVCKLADLYPSQIRNICFESIIENDELYFDYKLQEGICKNKNATFLMKKMDIIE